MSKFNFRMRSSLRNRDTDEVRFGRLTNLLDQMSLEIATERAGLADRYRDAVANAARMAESVEKGGDGAEKITELSGTIRTFETRMATLASQTTFVGQLHTAVDDFRASAVVTAANPAVIAAMQHKRASGAGR